VPGREIGVSAYLIFTRDKTLDESRSPEMARKHKGESPMDSKKIYLFAELTVLPEFLDDVKAALKQALIPTLQEAGCDGMFETSREGDPHKLVFFENLLHFGGT